MVVTSGEGVLLASSGYSTPLNVLQCTGWSLTTKNYLAPNVNILRLRNTALHTFFSYKDSHFTEQATGSER